MTQNILTAGDTVGNASLAGGNDGTLAVVVGPAGSKLTAMTIAADGTPTFIKLPVNPVQSMIRLTGATSFGTTNTAIGRMTTVTVTQGTDITYADSATLGGALTTNVNGVYSVSYSIPLLGSGYVGLSLNSTQLSTTVRDIPVAERLAYMVNASGEPGSVSWTGYLAAGSIIRQHCSAGAGLGNVPAGAVFTIARVA